MKNFFKSIIFFTFFLFYSFNSIAAEQSVREKGVIRLKEASEDLSGLDKFLNERPDLISS